MVALDGVAKRFGAFVALEPLSLAIAAGEFFALLGPSGCGKTTLLRLMGGFETPSAGRIAIDGRDVTDLSPERRPTNMVFQSYALFPHLSIGENVGYGLLNARLPRAVAAARVGDALARVRLDGFEARYPHQLSGGQRQRVALARALVCAPKVLLLDEPLGALDKRLREEMHVELREIQRAAGITFVLVTHDQEEAMSLADRIAVMARGRILQVDAPRRLYEAPASREVAAFISNVNLIDAFCVAREGARATLEAGGGLGPFVAVAEADDPRPGAAVILALRPEKLRLGAGPEPGLNAVAGRLGAEVYAGDRSHARVVVPGLAQPLLVTLPNVDRRFASAAPVGAPVTVLWPPEAGVLLPSTRSASSAR